MGFYKTLKDHPNIIGSVASVVCLIHCIATPFLFMASVHVSHEHHGHHHPWWWGTLDLLFLIISAIAVSWSVKNSSKTWIKYALWLSWASMTFILINEKIHLLHLIEELIYLPSVALIMFHLINRRYCRCDKEDCCSS